MPWNSEQYLLQVGVGNSLTVAIIDTGCQRTVIDSKMATTLGLPVTKALGQEFGTYLGCGGELKGYAGVIASPLTVKLSSAVSFVLHDVRVFDHQYPLFLLGADLLKMGKASKVMPGGQACTFKGLTGEYDASGALRGLLSFDVGSERHGVPLVWCPQEGHSTFRVPGDL